jgi:hypothetical protein
MARDPTLLRLFSRALCHANFMSNLIFPTGLIFRMLSGLGDEKRLLRRFVFNMFPGLGTTSLLPF